MNRKIKFIAFFYLLLLVQPRLFAQDSSKVHKGRLIFSAAAAAGIYAGTMIELSNAWYSQFQKTHFHFFNDNAEWGKMDKFGHTFTSYQLAKLGYADLKWCGVNKNTSTWVGGFLGLYFLTTVEILDGYSSGWGFSWGDITADATGSMLFIGQQKLWNEQRISLKYSYHKGKFADERPEMFGNSFTQRLYKDYNGQTYWLSFNINSFTKMKDFVPWLNVALGYSCDNMYYGHNPKHYFVDGKTYLNTYYSHNVYLSLDVDFTKIPTHKRWLRTVFTVLNMVKIPLPTVAYRQDTGLKGYWLYF